MSKILLLAFVLIITACSFNQNSKTTLNSNEVLEQKLFLNQNELQEFLAKNNIQSISKERREEIKILLLENINNFKTLTPSEVIDTLGVVSMEKDNGSSSVWYYYYDDCNIIIAWEKYINSNQSISTITEYITKNGRVKKISCLNSKAL